MSYIVTGEVYTSETIPGIDGKSAYELAVKHGFEGTEAEWLDSLSASAMDFLPIKTASGKYVEITDHRANQIRGIRVTGTTEDTADVYMYGKNLVSLLEGNELFGLKYDVQEDGGIHVTGLPTRSLTITVMPAGTLIGLPTSTYAFKWFGREDAPDGCSFWLKSGSKNLPDTGTGGTWASLDPSTAYLDMSFNPTKITQSLDFVVYPCFIRAVKVPTEYPGYIPAQMVTVDTVAQTGWEELRLHDDYTILTSTASSIDVEYLITTNTAIADLNNVLGDMQLGMSRHYGKNVICTASKTIDQNGIKIVPKTNGKYTLIYNELTNTFNTAIYDNATKLPTNVLKGNLYKMAALNFPDGVNLELRIYDGKRWTSFGTVSKKTPTKYITIPDYATGLRIILQFIKPGLDEKGNLIGLQPTKDASGAVVETSYDIETQLIATCTGDVPPPMLTIIDDDGDKKFHQYMLEIIKRKRVPIASAVPVAMVYEENSEPKTITIGGESVQVGGSSEFMTWKQIEDCAENGAEIMSHTYCNLEREIADKDTVKINDIAHDYRLAQAHLRRHGIYSEGLVFVGDSSNSDKCVEACKQVYNYGFKAAAQQTNYKGSVNRYGIYRWGATPKGDPNNPKEAGYSVEELKAKIDTLKSEGTGWMVWMIHTSNGYFGQTHADMLEEVIQYAIDEEIPIVTTDYGVKTYCT